MPSLPRSKLTRGQKVGAGIGAIVVAGASLIAISHSTWPNGPPVHTLRDPAERGRAMIQGGGPKPTEPV